ncbi:MAG TPA: lipopolysaccharide biosynthesis protein [Solirubrobacterales bacterium]|jgi:O-antigen/teichoic acid export membrane protein
MFDYLRRLATTGAAYTASSVLSKLIQVFLLPVYTAYLTPADYGAAEVMIASLVAASIVVRLGVIEAILRFYYLAGEDPNRVVRTGFASLFWTTTLAALVALPFAGPISEALLDERDAGLARLGILGLWQLTLWEYALTLLRLDERAKAYFGFTVAAVIVTIPVTVALVVATDMGASAILLGNFGTGVAFLVGRLWVERRRLGFTVDPALLRRMVRFGLPTMPAELTLYSLNFIDRILIVRLVGLAEAGLYALAVKFANGMQVLVRGFHLAWPPLAYSIQDDDEARRAYALIVTWVVAVIAFAVVGLWLAAPWLVRLLATGEFFEAHEAVGPLAAGTALYGLYLVLVIVLGRTGRTEFSFPATLVAVAVNVGLNLLLVPEYGIVGAGVALMASYVVVVGVMYALVERLFHVPYEWRRLALAVGAAAALIAVGELFVPHDGLDGLALTALVCAAYPLLLFAAGFLSRAERERLRELLRPAAVMERMRAARAGEGPPTEETEAPHGPALTAEAIEQATRDTDRGGA